MSVLSIVLRRVKDIKNFSAGATMDLGTFDGISPDSLRIEAAYLEELCSFFGRICEKMLLLGHKLFQKLKSSNEKSFHGLPSVPSSRMKEFAKVVLVALQYTRVSEFGVRISAGDEDGTEFSKKLAKTLQNDLKAVVP